MEIKQLIGDEYEQQHSHFSARQADIQTAMPGIILSYDPLKNTCSVQPIIQGVLFNDKGATSVNLPVLVDCPVVFPGAGNCTITFPIQVHDECLIIFSSRCIDSWWQNSGLSNGKVTPRPQLEMRMHDLSDGFVILGPKSIPAVIPNHSNTDIQIRSNDGLSVFSLNPTTHAIQINTSSTVNINSTGNTTVTAPISQFNGDIKCTGTITADVDVIGNGISLHNHRHSDPQGGNTGTPI